MHRGRAVCSAASEIMFGRRAVMAEPGDQRTAGATRNHTTSQIDKISNRKIDRPARMRGMLFLAA